MWIVLCCLHRAVMRSYITRGVRTVKLISLNTVALFTSKSTWFVITNARCVWCGEGGEETDPGTGAGVGLTFSRGFYLFSDYTVPISISNAEKMTYILYFGPASSCTYPSFKEILHLSLPSWLTTCAVIVFILVYGRVCVYIYRL